MAPRVRPVVWAVSAQAALDEVISYISQDSSEAAGHVLEQALEVGGHVVWLRVRDGTSGEIDLANVLEGPVFEPLRDPEFFRRFDVHAAFHTLVWPHGADVAPEFLRDNVR